MSSNKVVVRRRRPDGKLRAVGAYIFAGLFTRGVSEHFEVVAHLEDGPFGVATARRNFPDMLIHEGPPDQWPTEKLRRGGVDLVFANPPCAPWSAANGKPYHNWKEDVRVSCVQRTFELMERLRPKVWCFESVRGAYTKGRDMVDDMAKGAREMGYQVTHLLTDALCHGVPQSRKRYFMVCHRVRIDWKPTGIEPRTVKDAIGRGFRRPKGDVIEKMPDRLAKLLPYTEPGERLASVYDRRVKNPEVVVLPSGMEKRVGRPGFLHYRLCWDQPCGTITGSATKHHPQEERYISMAESKRLCGVPDDFEFAGKCHDQYAEIAKAVMPPVGEYIAERAAHAIRKDRRADPDTVTEVTIGKDDVQVKEMADGVDTTRQA